MVDARVGMIIVMGQEVVVAASIVIAEAFGIVHTKSVIAGGGHV